MPKFMNPDSVAKPSTSYSQAVEVPAQARRLIISGQVGVKPDGTIVKGLEAQTEQVFDNIFAVVRAAGMDVTDIVKIVTYCTVQGQMPAIRAARARKLGTHAPASTMLFISALANPEYLIEVEAEAVKEG